MPLEKKFGIGLRPISSQFKYLSVQTQHRAYTKPQKRQSERERRPEKRNMKKQPRYISKKRDYGGNLSKTYSDTTKGMKDILLVGTEAVILTGVMGMAGTMCKKMM